MIPFGWKRHFGLYFIWFHVDGKKTGKKTHTHEVNETASDPETESAGSPGTKAKCCSMGRIQCDDGVPRKTLKGSKTV